VFAKIRHIGNVTARAMRAKGSISLQMPLGTPVAQQRERATNQLSVNKMKKIVLLTVTFVTRWLSASQAQVMAYPHTHRDGMNVGEDYWTIWRNNDKEQSQFDPYEFRW
jgi:hypothetical protein